MFHSRSKVFLYTHPMIITPAERRLIILESLRHEKDLKQLAAMERRHAEKVKQSFDELDKVKSHRKITMIEHEEANRANRQARLNEVQARQNFIKGLNVI